MADKKLLTVWTSHLRDEQSKKDFENSVRSAVTPLRRLREILLERLALVEGEEVSDGFWEDPNIQERLIRNLGRKKELTDILRLLAFF